VANHSGEIDRYIVYSSIVQGIAHSSLCAEHIVRTPILGPVLKRSEDYWYASDKLSIVPLARL
jgi:hypothetical protein